MNQSSKKDFKLPARVMDLLKKGVRMTAPFSVEVGDEVDPAKISKSLVIYGAARIGGKHTFIAENVKLGLEAPTTIIDCQIGPDADLRGGYFAGSVFLNKTTAGSGAQIRPGCLLEEESGVNHCVGLKQTILFPYVQLGSLINFCDCLMAGGTSRQNHSEVGSSYIHFNFTPRQDKATASLIGDVPRGVMLREPPIFLGGQGGMVGPARIDFGTVIPAGVIYREAHPKGLMVKSSSVTSEKKTPTRRQRQDLFHKIQRNIEYIANLIALRQWYLHVRRLFFLGTQKDLFMGARGILDNAIAERIRQMDIFEEKIRQFLAEERKRKSSISINDQKLFVNHWSPAKEFLLHWNPETIGQKERDEFLQTISGLTDRKISYLEAIQSLSAKQAEKGSAWLQSITDKIVCGCLSRLKKIRLSEK